MKFPYWRTIAAAIAAAPLAVLGFMAVPSAHSTTLTYTQTIKADNPVGYWTIAAGGSTETDQSGHGHTGTYVGGTPATTAMPNGSLAADFNGSSQYLTVPSSSDFSIPTTHQLTWEGWIKPDVVNFPHTTGGYVDWMGKCQDYSPTCEWEARLYNQNTSRPSRLSAYVFNPSAGLGSGADWQPYDNNQIQAGKWYYVVAEYQTLSQPSGCSGPQVGGINIWVNGVQWDMAKHLQTGCMSQYGITPQAGSSPLNIGTMAFDSFFQGGVGKVAIYNYLLTQAQINNHYNVMTGLTPVGSCNYLSTGKCVLHS